MGNPTTSRDKTTSTILSTCSEPERGYGELLFTPLEFFTTVLAEGFSPEFEWQQVSRTRLRILAVLSNTVIWIVSTRPPTSKSSMAFNNPLVIVPGAPITIGTIVSFMFHSFFNSLARSRHLSFFSHSFRFILWSVGTAKSTILQILLFFLLIIIRSYELVSASPAVSRVSGSTS